MQLLNVSNYCRRPLLKHILLLCICCLNVHAAAALSAQLNPHIAFAVDKPLINVGESVTLKWNATNVKSCVTKRDWQQSVATSGSFTTSPLTKSAFFEITCTGNSGEISRIVSVNIRRLQKGNSNPIDNIQPGTWFELADSNYASVYPAGIPKSIATNSGISAIVDAWGGAAFDTKRERLMISGGGHHDYWGNDIFAFDINTLSWLWLYPHTDRIPHSDFFSGDYPKRQDSFEKWKPYYTRMQIYSDNSPAAAHTYDSLVYAPAPLDRLVFLGGTQHKRIHAFDLTKHLWVYPANELLAAGSGMVSAVDTANNLAYAHSVGESKHLFQQIDLQTLAAKTLSEERGWMGYKYSAALDSRSGKFLMLGDNQLIEIDTATGKRRYIRASGDDEIERLGQNPGFVYLENINKFVAWSGGKDIYVFDPQTRDWTKVRTLIPSLDDPGPANRNGTFGRFAYVPSKDLFILLNQGKGNVFFYKMPLNYPTLQFKKTAKKRAKTPYLSVGESFEITWRSTNTKACQLDGPKALADLPTTGKLTLAPLKASATLRLSCEASNGSTISREINVHVLGREPVVAYDFNKVEDNTVYDSSGNANHAKIHGAFALGRNPENTSNTLVFKGAKSALFSQLSQGFSNSKNSPQTIAIRAYLPKLKHGSPAPLLRFGHAKDSQGVIYFTTNKFENIQARIHFGSAVGKSYAYGVNSWHDLVFVYNGRDLSLYIDGKRLARSLHKKGKIKFGPELGIFALPYGSTMIDKLTIWQRALSSKEVASLGKH